ncbi:MAG TPA: RecX family transcriptional regulator [Anaeromyxobacteraceae bacterium]
MPHDAPADRARALALRVLSFHSRTEHQLRRRLERAGLGAEAAEVLSWLRRLGYLDDAAWARDRARALLGPGRMGPRGAERRIASAGIPAAEARRAVAEALAEAGRGGEAGELALCRALALRRTGGAEPAGQDERARARLARWLLGRGFSGGVVGRVVGLPGAPGDG